MIYRPDNVFLGSTRELFYDSEYVMDTGKYLNFAVALTGFDNESETILDPSIAELVFFAK